MSLLSSIVLFCSQTIAVLAVAFGSLFSSTTITAAPPQTTPLVRVATTTNAATTTPLPIPKMTTGAHATSTILIQGTSTSHTTTSSTVRPQQTKVPTPTRTPTPTQTVSYRDPEAVNAELRQSLVNILCTTRGGGYFRPISGSGLFISAQGVILTNAHVAQFFLLKDYIVKNNVDCIIRTGSPASAAYRAELLYLPPAWITANASQLKDEEAVGTGEDDYAFLIVTGRTDASPSQRASRAYSSPPIRRL